MRAVFVILLIAAVAAANMWQAPGTLGNTCSCCKTCASNLITIDTTGEGSHPFDSDVIDSNGECGVRTFTCVGKNANIEINVGGGIIPDEGTGTATLTVTCNAAGTAWEAAGVPITQVACAVGF